MNEALSPDGDDSFPDFTTPPVVEVAVGVQFRPLFGLRPIELATLRERWRSAYPLVQEQPPVPPAIEGAVSGPPPVQLIVGPALQTRLWFLTDDQAELVQLQHDRLTVNWRQAPPEAAYPGYPNIRGLFEHRFADVAEFVGDRRLGALSLTQVEIVSINAVDPGADRLGQLEHLLHSWQPLTEHHLGQPQQARVALVFGVPGMGRGPVRMYVAVDPARRPDGRPVLFLTFTVRGAPSDESLTAALAFMDGAHHHMVQSFAELTPAIMSPKRERLQ